MNLLVVFSLLWQVFCPQTFPFPGPKNAATFTNTRVVSQDCYGSSSGTSAACTFSSPVTAGHSLYVCVAYVVAFSGGATFSGDSNAFTTDPGNTSTISNIEWFHSFGASPNAFSTCAYILSAAGGESTITATLGSSSTANSVIAVEISGVSALDKSDNGSAQNSISSSISSLSITPSNSNDLLLGICMVNANSSLSAGTNVAWAFTSHSNPVSLPNVAIEKFVQSAAASITAQCSIASSNDWWGHIVSFH